MTLDTTDLTPATGTEVRIAAEDLLQPAVAGELRDLLVQRGVLVFKEIGLSDEEQVRLAGMMGDIRPEGEKGISKVTIDTSVNERADYFKGSFIWHMDGTHDRVPAFASLLSGRVLSQEGGSTYFANSYAAYEALPEEKKRQLEGLRVQHSFASSMRAAGVEMTEQAQEHWKTVPDQVHSLVWTHGTGRKSLVIGCHADHIIGMDRAQSDALLSELLDWATQPRFVYRHEWSVGDLLIWDNTGVIHRVDAYPLDSGRLMHRTTLFGEEAFS